MAQNMKYLAEIRNWDKVQLANVLNMNGLSDCTDAIKSLDIDGETFLNLTEGQLAFWRKYLNHVQIRRFWSVIQLARENPKDFIGNIENNINVQLTAHHEINRNRSPFTQSLENILGQKPGNTPANNLKQDNSHIYENKEIILQEQSKLAYKELPPKPVKLKPPESQQQQQQQHHLTRNASEEKNLETIPTENENSGFPNRFPPKPVQHVQPIVQNSNRNILIHQMSNSFLHQNRRISTNEVVNVETPQSIHRRVPSPNINSRPLPMPPKPEITFPLPPNVVPLIPNWKIGPSSDDDEIPIYDDVYYKTQPWYINVDRKQANDLLKGKPNGTFIARPSKREDYECSLSIIHESRIYNLAVTKVNNKLVIGKREFNTVNEIIEFFMENEMVLNGHNNEDIVVTLQQL